MKLEVDHRRKLRAFPVQLIEDEKDLVIRRGCVQLRLSGDGVHEIVREVLERASAAGGAVEDEIVDSFAAPVRDGVKALLGELRSRRLLVDADDKQPPRLPEGPLEIFYWHFRSSPSMVVERMAESPIAVLGVNEISRRLAATLVASGVTSHEVIDYPLLRNVSFFDAEGRLDRGPSKWPADLREPTSFEAWSARNDAVKCLVATADFGGAQMMRRWNEFAVASRIHFLPVMLQDLIGTIGPLVVPGETACFECLRVRQDANSDDPESTHVAEGAEFSGQSVVGHHPAFTSVLGDLAALELTRFYGGGLPSPRAGTLIEVKLLSTHVSTRKVLKLPRCRVCSPLVTRGSVSPDKETFMPGHPVDS